MAERAMDLFDAYKQDRLPRDEAYIVSSFINANTGYTIYEVISYSAVKTIYPAAQGLTFQSSGKKMHILIEPASYPLKTIEPYLRDKEEQIPLRFSELTLITAGNQSRIYIAKKPQESLSSFTVAKPLGFNVSFVFYKAADLYDTLNKFFELSFNKDAGIPKGDAKNSAKKSVNVIETLMAFRNEFGT